MGVRQRPGLGQIATLAAVCAIALAGPGSSRGQAGAPGLYVTYASSSCTFTLVNDSGTGFTTTAPGTYALVLVGGETEDCNGQLPDFRFTGPGVSIDTPIDAGTGTDGQFSVTLQPSATYTAFDANNQAASKITFTTAASGAPATVNLPTTSSSTSSKSSSQTDIVGSDRTTATLAFRGTLSGKVSTGGKLTLAFQGKPVTNLKAGRYTIAVVDSSKTAGFTVQRHLGKPVTITAKTFTGRKAEILAFKTGQWLYFAGAGKTYYFFVTSK